MLALYLKVTSTHVEFREYGNNLCEALLREDQIKLFSRGLNTNKPKEHVISPCLRLLTEIVSYDGGTAAGALYAYSDTFFKRLDTFLAMRHEYELDSVEGRQRPSVRYNALRFLCANLKLQGPNAKDTILGQGNIIRAVFQYIKSDSPSVVSELLNNLEQDVLLDKAISRTSKNRVFTERNLGRIATLYQFHESHDTSESRTINVQDVAHSFLVRLCTTVERGILIRTAEGTPQGRPNFGDEGDKLDFRIPLAAQESQRPQLVKNTTLASFLQGLRPYANVLQTELIIETFQAAPELLADYFLQKKSFSFEPKLTATWVGFSMFIISTIQLPIQRKCFHTYDQRHDVVTPNLHWILESILPRPLNQKVLMRCLNQSISLITFITVRILVAAFQKLEATLEFLVGPDRSELFIQFSKRCPEIRHVIAVFHRYSNESLLMREAITRLLALYYKVLPQFALEEKFDISNIISHKLRDMKSEAKCIRGIGLSDISLQNLLEIAERSPNMRWWHKPGWWLRS